MYRVVRLVAACADLYSETFARSRCSEDRKKRVQPMQRDGRSGPAQG